VSNEQYTDAAGQWSRDQYADSERYLRRRAELIAVGLAPGDVVLDLACGDGGLAEFLAPLEYRGVDLNEAMVDAARARGVRAEQGDLNTYAPPEPVAATTIFRALYYAHDRRAFFAHVAAYTQKKFVFDLNPRQYPVEDVLRDLEWAGFHAPTLTPFFVPQRVALPGPVASLAQAAGRVGPLARAILRYRFSYVVEATRASS
jgi:SAM-dependent methyltransferase